MGQPSGTWETYDAVGIREDLSDMIYNISPTETPFFSACAKTKASNTLHEWQTDALAAASTSNAVVEGDDATIDASVATVRLGNYTQIMDKVASVSGTNEAVDSAGNSTSMSYQIAKRSKELKRDIEATLLANQAKDAGAGNGGTARKFGSVLSWIATNDNFGGGSGASPTGNGSDARTDGDQRAFTEAQLKTVLQSTWTAGGEPDTIMVGGFNKQAFSGFTGGATKFDKSEDKKLTAAIDVYESDFGTLKVKPNRFMRTRDCLVLDMEYWKVAWLRPIKTWPLAKAGDTDKQQILGELTLVSGNEKASGGVFDLTTS